MYSIYSKGMNTKSNTTNKLTMSTSLDDNMNIVDPQNSTIVNKDKKNWFFNDIFNEEGYYVYDT